MDEKALQRETIYRKRAGASDPVAQEARERAAQDQADLRTLRAKRRRGEDEGAAGASRGAAASTPQSVETPAGGDDSEIEVVE